jgi:hypothetical protein
MSRRFHRSPLTEAERDTRRQADRERIEQAARELLTSDGWQRWIKVRSTNGLSRYSLRNQWIISSTCHARGIAPTYVAGFRAVLTLNRCVRKGETAIKILAPVAVKQRDSAGEDTGEKRIFFRTVPVFDVCMTDVLPGREPVPLAPPAQPIEGDSHAHLIAPLVQLGGELGYTIEIRELPEHGPGVRRPSQADRRRGRARQPRGPHPRPRARPRTRHRVRPVRSRPGRSPGRLRHGLRARRGRARRQRRVDPVHRGLGRRRRAGRDPRVRPDDRHDCPPHRERTRAPRAKHWREPRRRVSLSGGEIFAKISPSVSGPRLKGRRP